MNTIASSPRAAALSVALAIAGVLTLVPANEAKAVNIVYNTNGTSVCRATNNLAAGAFYYFNTYISNSSTSTQYLTCVISNPRPSSGDDSVDTSMFWDAAATAGSLTCTAQMASRYFGATVVSSGSTKTLPLAANGSGVIDFPPLTRGLQWETVNIICSVPAGFKLGLVQNIETGP